MNQLTTQCSGRYRAADLNVRQHDAPWVSRVRCGRWLTQKYAGHRIVERRNRMATSRKRMQRVVPLAMALGITAICVFATTAHAQLLGGDFRNTTLNMGKGMGGDLPLNVQTDQGKPQATGGVTVKEGDKVSFDYRGTLETKTAGFWRGEKDKTYRVLLRNADGKGVAIVEMQGLVRWNTDRNVTVGEDNFLKITIDSDGEKFVQITAREIKDGRLHIVAADGSRHTIYNLSCDFSASIEKTAHYADKPSKTQPARTSQIEFIKGKVSGLSMRTVAGPKSLFDTTLDLSEKDPKSTVVITLEGRPTQEFRILTGDVVNIDGFTDMKGKHEMMGGLLILSELQKRVVGKEIVLKCRKIGREGENDIYGVASFELLK